MGTIFTNTGRRIEYEGKEYEIVACGISDRRVPYVKLKPHNRELARRMREAILRNGNLTIRLGDSQRLVLGKDQFPYW